MTTPEAFIAAREEAIRRLEQIVRDDDRLEALWLQGSLATGEADALSDIDAYFAVRDDAFDDAFAQRLEIVAQVAPVLAWSNATTPGLAAVHALLEGPVKLDLFFERSSQAGNAKRTPAKVVHDKTGAAAALQTTAEPPRAYAAFVFEIMVRMSRQGAFWPIRLLHRGQLSTFVMLELDLINKEIAQAMALAISPQHIHTNPFSMSRALSAAQRDSLDALTKQALDAFATGDFAAMRDAHLAVFDALAAAQKGACAALGVAYPIEAGADQRIREMLVTAWPKRLGAAR